jgi:hypothetical protein
MKYSAAGSAAEALLAEDLVAALAGAADPMAEERAHRAGAADLAAETWAHRAGAESVAILAVRWPGLAVESQVGIEAVTPVGIAVQSRDPIAVERRADIQAAPRPRGRK